MHPVLKGVQHAKSRRIGKNINVVALNKEVSSKWLVETTLEKFKYRPIYTHTPKELIGDVRWEKGITIS